MTSTPKRSVGRPRRQPKSAHELQQQARENIRRTKQRYLGEVTEGIEQLCEKVDNITHRNRFTQEEMTELKQRVNLLYDEFVVSKRSDDEQIWSAVDARIDAALKDSQASASKPMTEEEWNTLHRLRPNGKRKPGPQPAKKKNIYSIEPGDNGLATERTPSQDCDELERQWMDNYIEEQKSQPKFLQGKRVRNGSMPMKPTKPAANFWI